MKWFRKWFTGSENGCFFYHKWDNPRAVTRTCQDCDRVEVISIFGSTDGLVGRKQGGYMNKRELARAVKVNAAALIAATDLAELLGDDMYLQILYDEELQAFVEEKQMALAERIRSL